MRWPLRAVLGEAWRSRRRLVAWIGLPVVLLLAGLAAAEVGAGTQLWNAEQRRQARGGDVLQVVFDPPLEDAGLCLRLARWPSIVHSGGLGVPVGASRAGFTMHPSAQAEVLEVSPGALPILGTGREVGTEGLVIGRQLADELGIRTGDLLEVTDWNGPLTVSGVVETETRFPQRSRVLFQVRPQPDRTQQCLVETRPHDKDSVRDALVAVGIATGNGAEVQPVASDDLEDAFAAYRARPSRYGWMIVAGVHTLFAFAAAWFGRAGSGLYRALGATRTDLAIMSLAQATVVIVPATVLTLCGAWVWLARTDTIGNPAGLWLQIARHTTMAGAATLVGIPLATLAVAGRRLTDLIRTRL